jgi:RNA polymerase sigma-70 factor (ECF subfamily)
VSGNEDEELIAAYRNSLSNEVLDELVRRYVGRVRALMYQMVLDDGAADDLTQEVFLRVVRHLSAFDGRAKFSTWLYRIAMNTCHSYLEREGRSRVEFRDELPERLGTAIGPVQIVLDAELQREIEAALAGLSPGLRAAIVLTGIQGLDPKEAARVEGCSIATMYWRIHQARKRLADRLQGYLS